MEAPDPLAEFIAGRRVPRAPRVTPGREPFRHLFVPAFLAFSLTPWLSGTGGALSTGAVLLSSMLVVWLAEQLYPREREWNARLFSGGTTGWRRLGRDVFYLFGVTQLTAALLQLAEPRWRAVVEGAQLPALWPSSAPLAVKVLLAFFLVELCSYWIHRAAHRWRLLWQFHSTHHFVTELNGLKSVRTHPVDNLVFHAARTLPLLALGAGQQELVAAIYFGGVLGILAHANLDVCATPLGLVLNYPQVHAAHHSAELASSNSNFGCHTVVWDRLFGTYRPAPASVALGVEPIGPRSAWQELAWPFFRWVSPPQTRPEARGPTTP